MDWPPMVTVPLLLTDSDLKGSNFPPSDFSESPSGFLSGGFDAGAAAKNAGSASVRAIPSKAPILDRFIDVLHMSIYVELGNFSGREAGSNGWIPSTSWRAY